MKKNLIRQINLVEQRHNELKIIGVASSQITSIVEQYVEKQPSMLDQTLSEQLT